MMRTPIKNIAIWYKHCCICKKILNRKLRDVVSNIAVPTASTVIYQLKNCFSIGLDIDKASSMQICVDCKMKLNNSFKFKKVIQEALGTNTVDFLAVDSISDSSPLTETTETSVKRGRPLDFTPTPMKRDLKKTHTGHSETVSQVKCNLFSDHSYSKTNEPTSVEKLTVDVTVTDLDHAYSRTTTLKDDAASIRQRSLAKLREHVEEKILDGDLRAKIQNEVQNVKSEQELVKALLKVPSLQTAIEAAIVNDVNSVATHLCSMTVEPGPSVLRTMSNTKSLQEEDVLSAAVLELRRTMPFVLDLLTTLCCPPSMHTEQKANTQHVVAMIYGMAMHNRNPQLSALQKMNTAVAVRMHANNDLLAIFHKLGVTMSEGSKLGFLDQLGTFNLDGVVKSIQQGKPGKITIDNIDGMLMAGQIRLGSGNRHYHYTASTYYPDRCDVSHLSMKPRNVPQIIDHAVFYLNKDEEMTLKENCGWQVGRLLIRFCPELKWMEKCIPKHIHHAYSDEMSKQSEVYPLKIILEDPKYYSGCIRVLDELIALMKTCYEKAGRFDEFEKVIIPLGGDQLVRVRTTGARDLRAGTHTREERLEPICPELEEFFHITQDFLEKMFKALHRPNSKKDAGCLPYYQVELQRHNANGQVKGKFQAHEDFVTTVGSGLLLKLSMDKMGMAQLTDKPVIPGLPENIARMHIRNRTDFAKQILSQIVDEIYTPFTPPAPEQQVNVVLHVPGQGNLQLRMRADELERLGEVQVDVPGVAGGVRIQHEDPNDRDDLKNYSTQLLQWYLHLVEFQDAIKEGDITRCSICLKLMIPFFYGHSSRSKYAVECIDYILKTELLLPEALAIRCRLASFVNPKGGVGNNKASDMQQENNILVLKDIIRGLGAGKTDKALVRASLAAPVVHTIAQHYQELLDIHTRDGRHTKKSDEEDVKAVVNLTNQLEPFTTTPGRVMEHYKGIRSNAFARIDKIHFINHLTVIANRLRRGMNVDFDV